LFDKTIGEKVMKKELLFYSTLLAALVAQGADFDRATLDKMLADLERSGKPENLQPGALCYFMYISSPQRAEYICRSCGERTYFPRESDFELLHNARKNVKNLRKLGLEIKVNEQAFCHKCSPDKPAFFNQKGPIYGVIADNPELKKEWDIKQYSKFQPGSRVVIKRVDHNSNSDFLAVNEYFVYMGALDKKVLEENDSFYIAFLDYFIHKDYIDENGIVLKETQLFLRQEVTAPLPHIEDRLSIKKGAQLSIHPEQPEGNPDRIRVSLPDKHWEVTAFVPKECLITDVDARWIGPSWEITINGEKRMVPIKKYDVEKLITFLEKKDRYIGSNNQREVSLKSAMPRLKELLGYENEEEK